MKRIVILTANELRHDFLRTFLASSLEFSVIRSYCEVPEQNLSQTIMAEDIHDSRIQHLLMRAQTEKDFFGAFCTKIIDNSNPKYISKGAINSTEIVNEVTELNPDIIISFGCSIIKSSLLNDFKGKFVNIHLGLSPYYRGTATNFFPFINEELSCVGATFMHIDSGIDTGTIIHQMRPTISPGDTIHQIGNRLIAEMAAVCEKIIIHFDELANMNPIIFIESIGKIYRKKDFTEEMVRAMYERFESGIIAKYLNNKVNLDLQFPILRNPSLK
ncbi:formyltransferase family protein [Flavobacterium sp. GT3R68]|uniref:formyltransferase family protein n=1 Tax=Flavobacterium sp. GT3R68 TaxID=2594437 RepID=UPI000F85C692|nr:formyltransferase family protein [Flavobacterium sp. GT3R68]RTY92254.1 hypothetical protein EKL32_17760 [Flavobacterium sp. GSN2]TRW92490.1 hypothetical protein FNW07_05685 [Flavobacterium sp. GT3R68]